MRESRYDDSERKFLVKGFSEGFSIEYGGPEARTDEARNIPFTVGNKQVMWDKIMEEVRLGRYAGPFLSPPYGNYIQSPVGLVPKSGNKTRLIFHLSYDFSTGNKSVNYHTPQDLCSVKYNDIDQAVKASLRWKNTENCECVYYAVVDQKSAFRSLPLRPKDYRWLIILANHPQTNVKCYFVEKCLAFGHSISCSYFQRFSNALKHIVEY